MSDKNAAQSNSLLKRSFAATRSPAFVAFGTSLVVSVILGPTMTGIWARHNATLQAHDEAIRRAVNTFTLEAEAFGAFEANFVLGVSRNNRVDPEAYTRLVGNIVSQQAALDDLIAKVPPETREKISKYEDALAALNGAMQKVRDVETMREFWERTSDLLVTRQALMPRLEVDPA